MLSCNSSESMKHVASRNEPTTAVSFDRFLSFMGVENSNREDLNIPYIECKSKDLLLPTMTAQMRTK
jgi:hypothetical protein